MNNLKIYVTTSDDYVHLIKPFQFLFNKFWKNAKVTILGYDNPKFKLNDNFEFVSLGTSTHTPSEWGTDLKQFFEQTDDEFFILMLEDMFIVKPVNIKMLETIKSLLNINVGRFNISNNIDESPLLQYETMGEIEEVELIQCTQDSNYRLSCMPSIWQTNYFLKYLQNGWSPWEFELRGSILAKNDGYQILGTKANHALYHSLAIRKGNLNSELDFRVCDQWDNSLDSRIASMLNKSLSK